jgi:hypothetical protein
MSNTTFETFIVSGLLVLIAAVAFLAWSAWRRVDRERDMEKLALAGVSYELRHNLQRMLTELAGIANGTVRSDIEIIPIVHPQLDALLSRPNEVDRKGLTAIRGNYNELSAHKSSLRVALSRQDDIGAPANIAVDAVIGSIASLYLWEEHRGRAPTEAHSTRSWDVRDWMKGTPFHADILPGLHLRDQVVERLRGAGMTLTPKPLTHTAHEFYSMRYDRKADPNAPFWKRKPKPAPEPEVSEIEAAAEANVEAPAPAETPPVSDPALASPAEPAPSDPQTVASENAGTEAVETSSETPPAVKPQTPGIVH